MSERLDVTPAAMLLASTKLSALLKPRTSVVTIKQQASVDQALRVSRATQAGTAHRCPPTASRTAPHCTAAEAPKHREHVPAASCTAPHHTAPLPRRCWHRIGFCLPPS